MTWNPETWTPGQVVSADDMNEQLRDQLELILPDGPEWQDWTPTLTDLTLGNGTVVARYLQVGGLVAAQFRMTFGSTSAITSTSPRVALPLPYADTYEASRPFGQAWFRDEGTASFIGWVESAAAGGGGEARLNFRRYTVSGSNLVTSSISSTTPFTWTTTDKLAFNTVYEID